MDPVELARTLSETLKPALPLLVTVGDTISEIVAGRAVTALEQWAIKVWRRLRQGPRPESTAVQVLRNALRERGLSFRDG